MTVTEIVRKYLKENDYDGLVEDNSECCCLIDVLCPCEEIPETCEAGYKYEGGEYPNWYIHPKKPERKRHRR